MVELILSGGQTGADQGALRAARAAGIATGGWAAKGWLTETGPAPWLAEYGLKECRKPGYPARTRANVRDSDATLWFGSPKTRGFYCTSAACASSGNALLLVGRSIDAQHPIVVITWLQTFRRINVAGNRESHDPAEGGWRGIGAWTELYLAELFARLIVPGDLWRSITKTIHERDVALWLDIPNELLGNETPRNVLRSDGGADRVRRMLEIVRGGDFA